VGYDGEEVVVVVREAVLAILSELTWVTESLVHRLDDATVIDGVPMLDVLSVDALVVLTFEPDVVVLYLNDGGMSGRGFDVVKVVVAVWGVGRNLLELQRSVLQKQTVTGGIPPPETSVL